MSALFILYKLCPAQLWISKGALLFFPPLFDAGFFLFLSFLLFPPLRHHYKTFFFCSKPGGFSSWDEGLVRRCPAGGEGGGLPPLTFPIPTFYPCDTETALSGLFPLISKSHKK